MAKPRTYYDAFRFRAEIAGVTAGHFWNVGPFKMTVSGVEVPVPHGAVLEDLPGQAKMQPFTIEGPLSELVDLYNLFKQTVDVATGLGETEPNLYQDIDFVQLDRDGSDLEIVRVFKAWGIDYEMTKFDKKENDKRRELLEMRGQYFQRLPV